MTMLILSLSKLLFPVSFMPVAGKVVASDASVDLDAIPLFAVAL